MNRRLLLINLKERLSSTVSPPIGLWSIRSNLPLQTTIYDNALDTDYHGNHVLGSLPAFYDMCGISARFSSQHEDMLSYAYTGFQYADEVHLGGAHAAFCPPPKWHKGKPPTGICRDGFGENYFRDRLGLPELAFSSLQMPRFSMEEIVPYWVANKPHDKTKTQRWLPIELSRGCGLHCNFCSITSYYGSFTPRKVDVLEEYFRWLTGEMAINELLIEDDSFDLRRTWSWEVIELLNKYDLRWSTPNGLPARSLLQLSKEQWEDLARGCWRLSLPFETGNPVSAELMNVEKKFLQWEEAQELVLQLREHGIQAAGFFIIGYPGETYSEVRQTLAYANSLPLTDRYIYLATPYPGSPLWDDLIGSRWLRYQVPEIYSQLDYRHSVINYPLLSDVEATGWRVKDHEFHERRQAL